MSIVTGEFKFELDHQPRIKWTNDAGGRPEWQQAGWWTTEYDMQVDDFSLLSDSFITGFDTLSLGSYMTLDLALVTENGTWSYFSWTNAGTGQQIWDLTTMSPFDAGYVGATFNYTYALNDWHMPNGSYLTATTGPDVPAPGAVALLLVAAGALALAGRTRNG